MRKNLLFRVSAIALVVPLAITSLRAQTTLIDTVTVTAPDSSASEASLDPGLFEIRRTGPTNYGLAVFFRLSGTASNGVDYEGIPESASIPAGQFTVSIPVKPIDDTLVEGPETVVLQIVPSPLLCPSPACGYEIGWPSNATVTIADDDGGKTNQPPFVQLNAPRENDQFPAPATISLAAFAQDPEDSYNVTVEFFEGANSLGFGTFVPTRCAVPYCPYFALTWSNVPPGYYALTAKATDSQGANSVAGPVHVNVLESVNIYATDPIATEQSAAVDIPPDTATFTVQRSGFTNRSIVVYYEISGTASNGVDYQKLPGQVTLPEGVWSADIVVTPIDDDLAEGTETVVLTLLPPCPPCLFANPPCDIAEGTNCYPIGPDNRAVAYIRDNDSSSTNLPPLVKITSPPGDAVFTAPADINIEAVTVDQDGYAPTIAFFANGKQIGEEEIVFIRQPDPGQPINFTFLWSNVVAGEYLLTADATDNLGAHGLSQPIRIFVTETNRPPGTNPPVVTIFAPDPIAVEGQFCWSNWWWTSSGSSNVWTTNSAGWRTNSCSTNTATFLVRRTGETNSDLNVYYSIGGTASNGVDYLALPGQVTIPAGRHAARITIEPIDDTVPERIESVLLSLQPPPSASTDAPPAYLIGFPSRAAAIILDNDQPRPFCRKLSDGLFHVCVPGTNGYSFSIRASTDLLNWSLICTNVVTEGAVHFVDPDATDFRQRFYQVLPAPAYSAPD